MNYITYFIKYPPRAIVLSLVLFAVGFVAMSRLEVRQYPIIDRPFISVTTDFPGASPDIIESQITKPLENALSSINGLSEITSESLNGKSEVRLEFYLEKNIEDAANDVRSKVSRVRASADFPRNLPDSEILKAASDARPMMHLVLYSDELPLDEVADYARNTLESQLLVVPGVASVNTAGGGRLMMKVQLDPLKLSGFGLTTHDVTQAINNQNIEKPTGYIITENKNINISVKANLVTEEDFNKVVIKRVNGYLVKIEDVAQDVKFDAQENLGAIRYNGRPAVEVTIVKQSTANDLDIAQEIRTMFPTLVQNLPRGMKMEIALDSTIFIERSLGEVRQTILEASVLVILVILFFLRSFRAATIPIVTIPLSLIGSFAIMYFLGFTVNTLTLLALVMAIGLVVDDAIVVLENIYRHIEDGMTPLKAAYKGASEIGSAVIAMTITLAAVYAPIALSSGTAGRLFTEFSITLAGAVILSGVIALSLSPMMCSRLLKIHSPKITKSDKGHQVVIFLKNIDIFIDKFLHGLDKVYARSLSRISHLWVLLFAVAVALFGYYLMMNIKQEMSSPEDQGKIRIDASPPSGSNLNYIEKYFKRGEKILDQVPEIDRYISVLEVNGRSYINAYLKLWENRDKSSMEITRLISPQFQKITGFRDVYLTGESRSIGSGGGEYPVVVNLLTPKSSTELYEQFDAFLEEIRKLPGIRSGAIRIPNRETTEEYAITVDRQKAALLGVQINDISEMLHTLYSRSYISTFERESKRYQISLQLPEENRATPEGIENLFVRGTTQTPNGLKEVLVPLAEVITIRKQESPNVITHLGGFRSAQLSAGLEPDASLPVVLNEITQLAQQTLPEGFQIEFSGASKKFLEEQQNVILIFVLAIIFIYLVLVYQYNSFIDPLIVMVSVPLSLVGGIFMLMFAGGSFLNENGVPTFTTGTLTIYAQIGLVTLVGLITKHGILIVEFANQLREEEGLDRQEAVMKAAKVRLRPILMTTFAMVAGALPLALSSGAGSELRREIGWVIVGGMSIGTLFTLYVLPSVYIYLSAENINKVIGAIKRVGKKKILKR